MEFTWNPSNNQPCIMDGLAGQHPNQFTRCSVLRTDNTTSASASGGSSKPPCRGGCHCHRLARALVLLPVHSLAVHAAVTCNKAATTQAAAPRNQLCLRLPMHSPTCRVVAEVRHGDAAGRSTKSPQPLCKLMHLSLCPHCISLRSVCSSAAWQTGHCVAHHH